MDPATAPSMIEAVGLTKYFGPFVAVQDISFSVPQGQIVAFLGPNGAGKTTMMRMMTGYLAPSAGSAAIAGFDVRRGRIDAARHLGYLPENGPLYPDMTPLDLLSFMGEARQMPRPHLRQRIDEVIELCGLALVLEKPTGKLSKGYRQRVGLAQALLHDPAVLIMDEPTAGLDPNQIRQFRENIQRLGRTKTLLISTHILHEAEAVADRVLLVNSGRLVFDGTIDDLKEDGSLERPFYRLTAGAEELPLAAGDGPAAPPDDGAQAGPSDPAPAAGPAAAGPAAAGPAAAGPAAAPAGGGTEATAPKAAETAAPGAGEEAARSGGPEAAPPGAG